jgi:hypothetical protein
MTVLWRPNYYNTERKTNKRLKIGKEDVKLSLFANDMAVYVENLSESTKQL